jgi:eukaryotic-like serine/threonine-protein kinase
MAPPGLLLGDRYQLAECIGVGGMGEVWRATDLALGRPVAVKLLRPGCAGSEEDRARFRAEARHAGSLSHPGIARVYDYREADPPYLVMELVDGPSLARLLEKGPVDPARTMGLIAQAAAALQVAHAAGLVHRDIKPGNLLVSRNGDVKVTDFGIAHVAGSASVTCPGMLTGTPAYLAPERAAGAPATPAADLYALGIVAYQCLTGRPPFEGEPLAVALAHIDQPIPPLPPSVPADVAALVAYLTAKDPLARPACAGEVADWAHRLRIAPAGRASSLRGLPAALETGGRGKPSSRVLMGLNAFLVLAIAATIIVAGGVIAGRHGPDSPLPSAPQRPHSAGSHSTHRAAAARRTGGATAVVHQSGPTGSQPSLVSGPGPAGGQQSPPGQKPAPSVIPSSSGPPSAGTPSPSGTPGPNGTPPASGTPSPTGSPAQTGTPPPTGNPTPTGTPPPTGSPTPTGTPPPTGSPTPTGTPPPTGSPTPSGTPPATGSPSQTGTPPPTGSPSQTGTPTTVLSGRLSQNPGPGRPGGQ